MILSRFESQWPQTFLSRIFYKRFQDIKDHQPPQSDVAEHEAEAEDEDEDDEEDDEDDEVIPSEVAAPPQPGHEEDEYEDGQVDWWDFATDLKSQFFRFYLVWSDKCPVNVRE